MRNLKVKVRKTPRQSRAKETVDLILEAAAHILKRSGYEALNTNALARKAGVSVGSIYQYFPGKEAIVAALIRQLLETDQALFERCFRETAHGSLPEKAHRLLEVFVDLHFQDGDLRRVIYEQVPQVRALNEVANVTEGMISAFARILKESREWDAQGRAPDVVAFVLFSACKGVLHELVRPGGARFKQEVLRELDSLVQSYLGC